MNDEKTKRGAGTGRRLPPGGGSMLAVVAASFALLWIAGSCRVQRESGGSANAVATHAERVVPDENVRFLEAAAARATAAAATAEQALATDRPDTVAARAALRETRDLLATVSGFYLPLTSARDLLVGAWYDQTAGRTAERDRKLAEAGNRLREVVENGSPRTAAIAGELLTALDSLELHKTTDSSLADDLRRLCRSLQERLTAAELELDRTPPAPAEPAPPTAPEQTS